MMRQGQSLTRGLALTLTLPGKTLSVLKSLSSP
jgi:hypothetical protein